MNQKKIDAKKKKKAKRDAQQKAFRERPRTCGDCRVCCYVFPLLDKPERTWCKHCTERGCGVYSTRAKVCRNYRCGWLHSRGLPQNFRPDLCGIIISYRGTFHGKRVFFLSQVTDGDIYRHDGQEIFKTLLNNGHIVMWYTNSHKDIGVKCTSAAFDQEEFQQWIVADSLEQSALLESDPFDFA